jgi:MerC mercury resistance protein
MLPVAALSLLPSFTCPACLAAYTGVLSFLGFGFLLAARVQMYLILFFFLIGLAGMVWSTRTHRRPGPIILTVSGFMAVMAGKIVWTLSPLVYAGVVLLIAGSLWNLWLKRAAAAPQSLVELTGFSGDRP